MKSTRGGIAPGGGQAFYLFTKSRGAAASDLADICEANALDAPAFCADWGFAAPTFQVVASLDDVPVGGIPCAFLDGLDSPDALAYHTLVAGRPSISVDVSMGLTAAQGGFSHEWKELCADMLCTMLIQYVDARGKVVGICVEVCDPVQDVARAVTIRSGKSIAVSAHVTPWWFDPAAPADVACDSAGVTTGPLEVVDGYCRRVNFTDGVAETVDSDGQIVQLDKHPATRGGKRAASTAAIVAALGRAA